MTDADPAIRKEQFAALCSSYARTYERFVENGFKTATLLLVILGWLLSAEAVRTYLEKRQSLAVACAVLIVLAASEIVMTFDRLWRLSRSLREKLDTLAYLDAAFYDQHRIPVLLYVSAIGQNIVVCGVILWILLFR